MGGRQHARRVRQPGTDNNLLGLVTEDFLHQLGQRLELCLELLQLLIPVIDVEALLGCGLQPLAVKLLELLDIVLGSRMYKTSRSFLRKASKKRDDDTAATLSAVM